jgi:hypothetical protein
MDTKTLTPVLLKATAAAASFEGVNFDGLTSEQKTGRINAIKAAFGVVRDYASAAGFGLRTRMVDILSNIVPPMSEDDALDKAIAFISGGGSLSMSDRERVLEVLKEIRNG